MKQELADPERFGQVAAELRERDDRDRSRAVSPLEPAPDAIIVDSSSMTIDEVVSTIERVIAEKMASTGHQAKTPE